MASISVCQSSCIVWNESRGVLTKDELAISSSAHKMSANVGRSWGSGFQQPAGKQMYLKFCLYWHQAYAFRLLVILLKKDSYSLSLTCQVSTSEFLKKYKRPYDRELIELN